MAPDPWVGGLGLSWDSHGITIGFNYFLAFNSNSALQTYRIDGQSQKAYNEIQLWNICVCSDIMESVAEGCWWRITIVWSCCRARVRKVWSWLLRGWGKDRGVQVCISLSIHLSFVSSCHKFSWGSDMFCKCVNKNSMHINLC